MDVRVLHRHQESLLEDVGETRVDHRLRSHVEGAFARVRVETEL